MPRDLPVSNGNFLLNFDRSYDLRDIYFPLVGQEDHTRGGPCRFGVWSEGQFAWLSSSEWVKDARYEPKTLVTRVICSNARLGLRLIFSDFVHHERNIFIRRVRVEDLSGKLREVRLFFHFDCHLWGHSVGDTGYFEPKTASLVHYKRRRWFWLGALKNGSTGLDSYAVGNKQPGGDRGTWVDAEDGILGRNPVAQGSIDTVGAVHVLVPSHGAREAYFWLAAAESFEEARSLNHFVLKEGPTRLLAHTADYWRLWVSKERRALDGIPESLATLYSHSLLILRSQIDNRGGIVAANDSDILQFGRDTYTYVWPRDGALVARALIHGGYGEVTQRFFHFCRRALTDEGYLLHKYNPDGSRGSTWHPWLGHEGESQVPIQEDETALVLMSLWVHFDRFRDVEFIGPLYRELVKPAGNFLAAYQDPETGLPLPSYDLWEERRGVFSYTVGAVWAGLTAAANFANVLGEEGEAARYRRLAAKMKGAARQYLYDKKARRYLRGLTAGPGGGLTPDATIDSSIYGLFRFGMFQADDPHIVSTMRKIEKRLWCRTDVGGMARYENDYYHQISRDIDSVPGNPWIICTLWLAQWHIARAQTLRDLKIALKLLSWVADRAFPSGVLAEQVHPFTGEPVSVSPLTWSHAELVATVEEYQAKLKELRPAGPMDVPEMTFAGGAPTLDQPPSTG